MTRSVTTERERLTVARLDQVASINPRLDATLEDHTPVSFVPMSAVYAETGTVEGPEERSYASVAKGFTPFERGDILVAKITPCFENGKVAHALIPLRYGFGSTEFHVVRPHPGKLDARYTFHFLRQERVRAEGESRMTGSAGQRRVPENFITALPIPLPPLAEQRRIAAILDKADALRAKRRQALAELNTLTQSIFLEMFGDPATNPKKWPVKSFGEVGELDRGVSKHRPRNDPVLLDGPYPLVQTSEVTNSNGYIRRYNSSYSETGLRQSRMWPAGTLCITIAANIARTGILTFDACFPDSVVGFVSPDHATVEYVRVWLSFLQKTLEDNAPQFAQKNINLAILRSLQVPCPPTELQRAFADRLENVELVCNSLDESRIECEKLFTSLQGLAFQGGL